jgi:hypothetical protein
MNAAVTEWTLECVVLVLRNERQIIGLDRQPYMVGDHAYTGGPVLRGPWGSMGGSQAQFKEYDQKCKDFTSAYIHGHLRGARVACEAIGCIGFYSGYCQRCGGTTPPGMEKPPESPVDKA